VRVAVCTVRGDADARADRLMGQGIEARTVTGAAELAELAELGHG
jgi:hypothetical protein